MDEKISEIPSLERFMPKSKFDYLMLIALILFASSSGYILIQYNTHPSVCYYSTVTQNNGEYLSNTSNALSCIKPGTNPKVFLLCYRNSSSLIGLPSCTNAIVPNPFNNTVPLFDLNHT